MTKGQHTLARFLLGGVLVLIGLGLLLFFVNKVTADTRTSRTFVKESTETVSTAKPAKGRPTKERTRVIKTTETIAGKRGDAANAVGPDAVKPLDATILTALLVAAVGLVALGGLLPVAKRINASGVAEVDLEEVKEVAEESKQTIADLTSKLEAEGKKAKGLRSDNAKLAARLKGAQAEARALRSVLEQLPGKLS